MSLHQLKVEIEKIIRHVEALPPNPSTEQLTKKVCQIAVSLKRYGQFKDIISTAFLSFGFNISQMEVMNMDVFNISGLISCIHQIDTEIESYSPSIKPTDEELNSLSMATDKLWELDTHRLCPEVDYSINLQCGKKSYEQGDFASEPFFKYVKQEVLNQNTFKLFMKLFDNFIANVNKSEIVTPEEIKEQKEFINAIMDTTVMQYVHQYLLLKGKTNCTTKHAFAEELYQLWFTLYTRRSKNDSSGFEHVFIGEIKDGDVIGMHNWIFIYILIINFFFLIPKFVNYYHFFIYPILYLIDYYFNINFKWIFIYLLLINLFFLIPINV